jgi:hypothetical protein
MNGMEGESGVIMLLVGGVGQRNVLFAFSLLTSSVSHVWEGDPG